MTTFKIAHIKEQGQEMIIVPVNPNFGRKSHSEQQDIMNGLRVAASSAGLAGTVVIIWADGSRVAFIAPRPWHPFFQSAGIYSLVMGNINRELIIPG